MFHYTENSASLLESQMYHRLTQLNLVHWIPVFATLAVHYRGLERAIEPDDPAPLHRLSTIVSEAVDCIPNWRDRLLFERLSRSDLFYYHARNETGLWNPLVESLEQFSARGRTAIFEDHTPFPDLHDASDWLRAHLQLATRSA